MIINSEFYQCVMRGIPDSGALAIDIARSIIKELNEIPRERSAFELADVIHMLGHLAEWGLVCVRRTESTRNGCVIGAVHHYSSIRNTAHRHIQYPSEALKMTQPYSPTEKNILVTCDKCGFEHNKFYRVYTKADANGLRYLSCPSCGALGFTSKPAEPGEE